MEQTACLGTSQCMKPGFRQAMPDVRYDKERVIEEYLFRFTLVDAVLVGALATVAVIPLKALDSRKVDHSCIL
jgi:hypothetical protein